MCEDDVSCGTYYMFGDSLTSCFDGYTGHMINWTFTVFGKVCPSYFLKVSNSLKNGLQIMIEHMNKGSKVLINKFYLFYFRFS